MSSSTGGADIFRTAANQNTSQERTITVQMSQALVMTQFYKDIKCELVYEIMATTEFT
jgi:hypothetical protein